MSERASDEDAAIVASLEGLSVEFEHHHKAFMDAAVSTIANMEARIIRDFPQFYSNEQRMAAGVPHHWFDPLYLAESLRWRFFAARYRPPQSQNPARATCEGDSEGHPA